MSSAHEAAGYEPAGACCVFANTMRAGRERRGQSRCGNNSCRVFVGRGASGDVRAMLVTAAPMTATPMPAERGTGSGGFVYEQSRGLYGKRSAELSPECEKRMRVGPVRISVLLRVGAAGRWPESSSPVAQNPSRPVSQHLGGERAIYELYRFCIPVVSWECGRGV